VFIKVWCGQIYIGYAPVSAQQLETKRREKSALPRDTHLDSFHQYQTKKAQKDREKPAQCCGRGSLEVVLLISTPGRRADEDPVDLLAPGEQ
jgi:hypothetical protein